MKINEAAIQRQAFLMGLTKSQKDTGLSDATKAMAIYGLVLESTATATKGDFLRNQKALANTTRRIQAQIGNAWVNIGQFVLPTVNLISLRIHALILRFNNFAQRHPTVAKVLVLTVGAFGALLVVGGSLLVMLGAFNVAWGSAVGGLTLLNLWYNRNIVATYRNAVAVGAWTTATNMSTFAAMRNATGLAGLRLALIGVWTQVSAVATATWTWVTSQWASVVATYRNAVAAGAWATAANYTAFAVMRNATGLAGLRLALIGTWTGLVSATGASWAWVTSLWAANAALLANPITWVVLAVVGLIAGIYGLYRAFTAVREPMDKFLYWAGFIVGVFEGTLRMLKKLLGWTQSIGRDLILGVIKGIFVGAKTLWKTIRSLSEGILNRFKSFFGIRSPSRLFAEQGSYLVEGIQVGMERKSGGLFNWLKTKLGPGIVTALKNGWDGAKALGGAVLNGLGITGGTANFSGAAGTFDVNSIAGADASAQLARSAVSGITEGWAESIPGYCSRFVRQVFQKTLGPQTAKLFGSSAIETERIWKAQGLTKTLAEIGGKAALKAGDVLFQGFGSGGYGHTAVYLGNGKIAHNTTANGGGKMISSLDSFGAITSVGRLPAAAPAAPPRPTPRPAPPAAPRPRAQQSTTNNRPVNIGTVNLPNVREPDEFVPALRRAVEAHQ